MESGLLSLNGGSLESIRLPSAHLCFVSWQESNPSVLSDSGLIILAINRDNGRCGQV